jgi:ATP:ADP antiporter, AAA family
MPPTHNDPAASVPPSSRGGAPYGLTYRVLRLFLDVKPEETAVLGWSWLYLFSVFFAYFVIRPIRDAAGAAGGVNNLPWLFTGTLVGMMLVNTPYAALVARLPRARFISLTYRFFMLNLLIFLVLFRATTGQANIWVGRVFFIWTAVFNLFVVSVFWQFMADVFTSEQSKRMFGFIAAAATLGGLLGGLLTASTVRALGVSFLLIVSALLLELGVFAVRRLAAVSDAMHTVKASAPREASIGGSALAGLTNVLRSPYLLNICVYMLLYSTLSTFLYFQQIAIVAHAYSDRASQTALFGWMDFAVNALTIGGQLFVTGAVLKRLGVAVTLTLIPAVTVAGFVLLGIRPTVIVLIGFYVLRRAGNYTFAQPSRNVLFTVVSREDKYKAKSVIDTVVYRLGDQVGAWSSGALSWMNVGLSGIAWAAVPIAAAWAVNAWWLGRRHDDRARGFEPLPNAPGT